mgnify:CR=1 FL=1
MVADIIHNTLKEIKDVDAEYSSRYGWRLVRKAEPLNSRVGDFKNPHQASSQEAPKAAQIQKNEKVK